MIIKSKKTRAVSILLALAMIFTFFPQLGVNEAHADHENTEAIYDNAVTIDGVKYHLDKIMHTATVASYQDQEKSIDVIIPDRVSYNDIEYSVTEIEESAFFGCVLLRSIKILAGVPSISSFAFANCHKLSSIKIPASVTSIDAQAFSYCTGLSSIIIPADSRLTTIREGAFIDCSNLRSITIPCDFDKTRFANTGVIPSETDDTFQIDGTGTTGTFEYAHDYGETVYIGSDPENSGLDYHHRICKRDSSHRETQEHEWDKGKVTRQPTFTKAGTKTFTCALCRAERTKDIPKLKAEKSPMVKIKAKGKTGLSITWEKVDKASEYDIFFSRCGHDRSCKKVKTIKGNKTFKWIKTGLKKETAYKAYVKAYFTEKGKKVYVKTSPLMRAYTGGST